MEPAPTVVQVTMKIVTSIMIGRESPFSQDSIFQI